MSRMKTSNYKSSLGITSNRYVSQHTSTFNTNVQRAKPSPTKWDITLNTTTVPYVLDERVKL